MGHLLMDSIFNNILTSYNVYFISMTLRDNHHHRQQQRSESYASASVSYVSVCLCVSATPVLYRNGYTYIELI